MKFKIGDTVRFLFPDPIAARHFSASRGQVLTDERRSRPCDVCRGFLEPGYLFYRETCVVIGTPRGTVARGYAYYVQFDCGSIKEVGSEWIEAISALELLAREG